MNEILRYAEVASEAWMNLSIKDQETVKKYFHLRPTKSGVTLVTTLPFLAMRGKEKLETAIEIGNLLKTIIARYGEITQDDDEKAKKIVLEILKIRKGARDHEKDLEYDIQARMINHMSKDANLARVLGSDKEIKFIASELIFEQGPNRVDVVGFNGKTLYFFELKKDRTTKVEQVKEYVNYYRNSELLKQLLSKYPINPVKEFQEIKGVMVMRHAEGSAKDKKWKSLAEKNQISIVFYSDSFSFEKVG